MFAFRHSIAVLTCIAYNVRFVESKAGNPFENVLRHCGTDLEEPSLPLGNASPLVHGYIGRINCNLPADACHECFNVSNFLQTDTLGRLTAEQLEKAAVQLVYLTLNTSDACSRMPVVANESGIPFLDDLTTLYDSGGNSTLSKLTAMLEWLNETYTNENTSNDNRAEYKCFNAQVLLYQAGIKDTGSNISSTDLVNVAAYIFVYAAKGFTIRTECELLPSTGALSTDLFAILDAGDDIDMSLEDFSTLLSRLHAGQTEATDHDHSHEADHSHTVDNTYPDNHLPESDHAAQKCLSAEQLLTVYQVDDSRGAITLNDLTAMCPGLLQQAIGGYCKTDVTPDHNFEEKPSLAEIYGYGTLAVVFLSIMPVFGIVIIPCFKSKAADLVLTFFVALGAGSMLGDALLHLLPDILGEHNHRTESHSSEAHSDKIDIPESTWKMLTVCGVIYIFFVMEMVLLITRRQQHLGEETGHGHSHGHSHMNIPNLKQLKLSSSEKDKESMQVNDVNNESTGCKELSVNYDQQEAYITPAQSTDHIFKDAEESKRGGCNIHPMALVLIAGDALHNIADGLAIGVAFATRLSLGLTVTIAVFSHEVPHKLANFAVLLSAGYPRSKVLGLNLFSTSLAIGGFFIGATVGSDETVASYILAATAATFFYVCLLDLLPEIMHKRTDKPWLHFVVMNVGLLSGFIFMLLFVIFEERIDIG